MRLLVPHAALRGTESEGEIVCTLFRFIVLYGVYHHLSYSVAVYTIFSDPSDDMAPESADSEAPPFFFFFANVGGRRGVLLVVFLRRRTWRRRERQEEEEEEVIIIALFWWCGGKRTRAGRLWITRAT